MPLSYLLKVIEMVSSSSEGKRLIQSGAVKINDEKVTDPQMVIPWRNGDVVRVGKRRIRRSVFEIIELQWLVGIHFFD